MLLITQTGQLDQCGNSVDTLIDECDACLVCTLAIIAQPPICNLTKPASAVLDTIYVGQYMLGSYLIINSTL